MKIVLIQGDENTGKTTLCNQIDEWLQKESFLCVTKEEDKPKKPKHIKLKDFRALYKKDSKKIILNTLSDDNNVISDFEAFLSKNQSVDILITVIRPNAAKNTYLHEQVKKVYGNVKEDLLIDMEQDLETIIDQIKKFFDIVENIN